MGTIAQELQRIQTAKSNLKTAIEAKGVTVPSATTIDGYATLVGQIQTGATEAPENDVNFYDYDGFRVASFTIAEAKALTQAQYNAILPPTHEGLTFQEWNWSLNDITTYNRRYIDVGANYVTTDKKTHIKIYVKDDITFNWIFGNGTLTVDWGDNSTPDTNARLNSGVASVIFNHTYAQSGTYTIKIEFAASNTNGLQRIGSFYTYNNGFRIIEFNCGEKLDLTNNLGLANKSPEFLISISNDNDCNFARLFEGTSVKQVNIPKGNWSYGVNGIGPNGKYNISFPNTVVALGTTGTTSAIFNGTFCQRMVVPEYNGSAVAYNFLQNLRSAYIISIPSSFQFVARSQGDFLSGNSTLKGLDIVNGWTPSQSMNFSYSTQWYTDNIVDFFNKLGATSTAITLTFGSTNLDKLTADQKAIATNKGYTLA